MWALLNILLNVSYYQGPKNKNKAAAGFLKIKEIKTLSAAILITAFFLALAIVLSCIKISSFFDILKYYLGI